MYLKQIRSFGLLVWAQHAGGVGAPRVRAQPPAPFNRLLRLPKCGAQELLLFLEPVPRPEPLQPTADFMELSGGSLANNVGCCAECGGAQLPPPAGAALLVWLWLPVHLFNMRIDPQTFLIFSWISIRNDEIPYYRC